MPQGAVKVSKTKQQKTNKKAVKVQPKRVWKKRKDPVKAALARKVDAIVMDKAMKDPLHGGLRFIKPNEENTKAAKVSTKQLIKDPTKKIK